MMGTAGCLCRTHPVQEQVCLRAFCAEGRTWSLHLVKSAWKMSCCPSDIGEVSWGGEV